MKRIILAAAVAAMTMTTVEARGLYYANAADTDKNECPKDANGDERWRMTREKFAEMKSNYIAQQLGLDEATTKKFNAVYAKNQKEIWDIISQSPRRGPLPDGQRPDRQKPEEQPCLKQSRSDAESEKQIKGEFKMSRNMISIREKYYNEYSKFLTQQQIQRVYEIERRMHERFAKRGAGKQGKRVKKADCTQQPQQ